MSKEAMKLALEALQEVYWSSRSAKHDEAITALREALAEQPAQQCRTDGRCQYAIDSGAEGMGHCPKGKCVMPAQQEKDWGAVGEAHIAAIKKSSKAMVEDAVVRAAHKVMAEFEAKLDERLMEPPAQQEPEFFTHCVDQPYDWSEWVCPDPKGYLMKCCDCGLVHEAEFGVVRYKSETEREDCDMVDDPNLQAVFRMRRSEQWSPADMAHRAGGLTMEQPAQQTIHCKHRRENNGVCPHHNLQCGWPKCNEPEQPAQQEPVATKLESQRFNGFPVSSADFEKLKALPVGTKLYTTPQVQSAQRTVGDAQEWDDRHGTGGSYGIGGCYGPAAFTDGGLDGY